MWSDASARSFEVITSVGVKTSIGIQTPLISSSMVWFISQKVVGVGQFRRPLSIAGRGGLDLKVQDHLDF